MSDITIVNEFDAALVAADLAYDSDFFVVAPSWAREAIVKCLAHGISCEAERRHLISSVNCVKSVNYKMTRQVAEYGTGKTSSIRRHKRTRAQIRASKATESKAVSKKKTGK